ncbi:purine-cytosine permease family protein [Patulibacter defluvii]|uniref:purine-cytosine permease family protein n=1 Tax=Patulibacter defluvii TaxID=3095358 RepID=UPI002A7552F7|nr:cytosine permease [Patulibacter sp. DM4]
MTQAPSRPATTAARPRIEARSIDYVPLDERHGRLGDQATVWFASSACLLTLATGAIGITLGLGLLWTIVALTLGTVVASVLVAAHASQGPHLGLPQMVQSRPQFGRYGALFIWATAVLVYWGYAVSGFDILGDTLANLLGGSSAFWLIAMAVLSVVLAIVGHDWLHVAQRLISVVLVVFLAIFTVGIVVGGHLPTAGGQFTTASFSFVPFLTVFAAALGYQLSWAFYVSDYSRYMPAETSHRKIISVTFVGLVAGVLWMEVVGAIAAAIFPKLGVVAGVQEASDLVFQGLGAIMLLLAAAGTVGLMGMSLYGGSLTLISALDSLRPIVSTVRLRVATIGLLFVSATGLALALPADFLATTFVTVLAVLGYLMGPWTAINLTDYFLVRRGRYSVREIFNPAGIYGRWNWRGCLAYAIAFAAMVPFMHLEFFEGPMAKAIDGVDLAIFVGLPVAAGLYALFCRSLDVAGEARIVAAADADLDGPPAAAAPRPVAPGTTAGEPPLQVAGA